MFNFNELKKSKKGTKKGIMFTIVSVLVCALIITSFFAFQSVSLDKDVDNAKLRIKGIDRFVADADTYVAGLAYVSGRETIDFTLDIMIGNNSFINNYSNEFVSCMMNGTMKVPWSAVRINCSKESYMLNRFNAFEDFSNSNLNLKLNMTLNGVKVEQTDPFEIDVVVNYTIMINDSYAFWSETRIVRSKISIDGLRDPLYGVVNASPELSANREKNHTISVAKVNSWIEMPSTAHNLIINDSYFAWNGGVSYFNRLKGNFNTTNCNPTTDSCACSCGIVSIVSYAKMSNYSINHATIRSSVDSEFWTGKSLGGGAGSNYRQYNFYKSWFYELQRLSYGVTSSNANLGLNGSVLPGALMAKINMTNTDYTVMLP